MKKIFTLLFVLSCVCGFADNDDSIFEEVGDEECRIEQNVKFSAEEPICEEDDCEDGKCTNGYLFCYPPRRMDKESQSHITYPSWKKYKVNFGIEKVFIRFPYKPNITQTSTLFTAFAYDNSTMYTFTGYYPPIGNISPGAWFDEILYSISHYPTTCLSHVIFQTSYGDWVLDYVAHDYEQNLIIKTRSVVTPFNAYTIQCVKPYGFIDNFDYFVDSFWIKCECSY